MSNLIYDKERSYLTWNGRSYPAKSGNAASKPLENGKYRVETNKVVSGIEGRAGFMEQRSKSGWFIPIIPLFDSERTGLGIHPDGGASGTAGCVGISGQAASMFWKAWLTESMHRRPNYLVVVERMKAELNA